VGVTGTLFTSLADCASIDPASTKLVIIPTNTDAFIELSLSDGCAVSHICAVTLKSVVTLFFDRTELIKIRFGTSRYVLASRSAMPATNARPERKVWFLKRLATAGAAVPRVFGVESAEKPGRQRQPPTPRRAIPIQSA
jgi:hypothetical protein